VLERFLASMIEQPGIACPIGTVRHDETNNMVELLRSNFNGHTLFILVRDILNNEEFVG
jgi:hypothetical protein